MLISALKVTNPTESTPYEHDYTTHMKIRHKIYADDPFEEFIVDGEEKVPFKSCPKICLKRVLKRHLFIPFLRLYVAFDISFHYVKICLPEVGQNYKEKILMKIRSYWFIFIPDKTCPRIWKNVFVVVHFQKCFKQAV